MSSPNRDLLYHQARKISDYWSRFGARVDVQVVREESASPDYPTFVIRSDMVNGLPRKPAPDLVKRIAFDMKAKANA